jgi:uncharacterized protein with PQ loop repeat
MVNKYFYETITWLPGIVFITGYLIQIFKIYKTPYPEEVEKYTFLMILLANIGAYLFTNKFFSLKAISAYIIPSVLQIIIIAYSDYKKKNKKEAVIYSISLSILLILLMLFVSIFQNNKLVKKYLKFISKYAGFIAILFPIAAGLQLFRIIKDKDIEGVSIFSWLFLSIGQFGCYFLAGKYGSIQSILAFIGAGVVNLSVALYTIYLKKKNK